MYSLLVVLCTLTFCVDYSWSVCSNGVYENTVSDADAAAILKKHNDYRMKIAQGKLKGQPRGTNLKRMKYSKILAQKAQEIANTCVYGHVPVTGTQWNYVGQNIFQFTLPEYRKNPDWDLVMSVWWGEHEEYRYGTTYPESVKHYAQMAWAETEYVGCGYVHFPVDGQYQKNYVCNYGPGGDVEGSYPYQTGSGGCENLC